MTCRYLPHSRYPRWAANSYDLKEQLGLPKRLAPRSFPHLVGHVVDSAGDRIEIWDLPDAGFHRLHARYGTRFVPAGRVHQTKDLTT